MSIEDILQTRDFSSGNLTLEVLQNSKWIFFLHKVQNYLQEIKKNYQKIKNMPVLPMKKKTSFQPWRLSHGTHYSSKFRLEKPNIWPSSYGLTSSPEIWKSGGSICTSSCEATFDFARLMSGSDCRSSGPQWTSWKESNFR